MSDPRPRIVVLDGRANNPGDLSWEAFEALGEVEVYAESTREQIRERAAGASIVCTNKAVLDAELIAELDELRYIGVLATGVNVVDREAARARDITVCNVPEYGGPSVAQHAMGLLLACASRIAELDRSVQRGEWTGRGQWCYWFDAPIELADRTLGLIGLGDIGGRVAEVALALGMRVISYTPSGRSCAGVEGVSLAELVANSDAISLHCPLTDDNAQMVDADFIDGMRPGAILVNTARGGLLDEQAVADALHAGRLAAVGVDVLSSEPPAADNPLLTAPRCVITPHAAWGTRAARARLLEMAAESIAGFLRGEPRHVVA